MKRLLLVLSLLSLPALAWAQPTPPFPSQNVVMPVWPVPASAINGGGTLSTACLVWPLTTQVCEDAINVLTQRNSTSAQRWNVANTYTSATNNELFSVDWQTTANNVLVGTRTAATGTGRNAAFLAQANSGASNFTGMVASPAQVGPPYVLLGQFTSGLGAVSNAAVGTYSNLAFITNTATSGSVVAASIAPTYNQASGTAANTDLLINRTQTLVGSGSQLLIDAQVGGASKFSIDNIGNLSVASIGTLPFLRMTSNTAASQGGAGEAMAKTRTITAIANNTATDVFTVTIPNTANSATIRVMLSGSLGAGGAIGANEATGNISYDFAVTRTAGVATVVSASTAYGSSTAAVAGAATITITAAATAMTGLVSAQQTFTIQVTIARGSGSSTNHTCRATAEILNANATGITIS